MPPVAGLLVGAALTFGAGALTAGVTVGLLMAGIDYGAPLLPEERRGR